MLTYFEERQSNEEAVFQLNQFIRSFIKSVISTRKNDLRISEERCGFKLLG